MKCPRPCLVFFLVVSLIALEFTQIWRARVHSLRLLELKVRKVNMSSERKSIAEENGLEKTLINDTVAMRTIPSDAREDLAIENGKTFFFLKSFVGQRSILQGYWYPLFRISNDCFPWTLKSGCITCTFRAKTISTAVSQ